MVILPFLVVLAGPVRPCGVYPLGEVLADFARSLQNETHAVHAPVMLLDTAMETGSGHPVGPLELGLGWAWGSRETGFLPGSEVQRVIGWWRAPVTRFGRPIVGLSYGRFGSAFGMTLSADGGLELTPTRRPGPIGRLALGGRALAVELRAWLHLGADAGVALGLRVDFSNGVGAY